MPPGEKRALLLYQKQYIMGRLRRQPEISNFTPDSQAWLPARAGYNERAPTPSP